MKKTHLFQAKHYCVPSKIGVFESCPEQRQHFFQALEVNGLKQRPQPTGHIAPSQNQDENQEKSQAENADSQDAQPQWKIIHVQHVIHTCRII